MSTPRERKRATVIDGGSKNSSMWGRRARYDCCTDCGEAVANFGDLWCPRCDPKHIGKRSQEARDGHRARITEYAAKGGLG